MSRIITIAGIFIVLLSSICMGGSNPNAKVAVHIMSHTSRSCTRNFPSIDSCEDVVYTYPGGGDIDFFVVFYDLMAYQGFQYAVTWPADWSSCKFKSCSDIVVGGIEKPGDRVAHAYGSCVSSEICVPGFGWIDAGDDSGYVEIIELVPDWEIQIGGCDGEMDSLMLNFRAGVGGCLGDDPCGTGGRASGGGAGEGGAPALKIVQVIEVTDGSPSYMQPIWSPDGKKLAFTKSGFTGLYVRNADGSGPIQEITSADYSGYKPVWTSDSKALVLRTRTGIVGQSITSIDVETGEVKTLVERAEHPGQPQRNAFGDVTVTLNGETKVLDRETGTFMRPDEYYPSGQSPPLGISLKMDFRDNRLTIVEGDGLRSTEFPHKVLLASLSPTQDKVAFKQGDGNIYISRLDGSSMTCVGRGSGWDWAPDGKRLVYLGAYEQDERTVTATELFVVNADGTGLAQLSHTPDQVEHYPVWSPDGMRIAYSTVNAGKILVAILEEVD